MANTSHGPWANSRENLDIGWGDNLNFLYPQLTWVPRHAKWALLTVSPLPDNLWSMRVYNKYGNDKIFTWTHIVHIYIYYRENSQNSISPSICFTGVLLFICFLPYLLESVVGIFVSYVFFCLRGKWPSQLIRHRLYSRAILFCYPCACIRTGVSRVQGDNSNRHKFLVWVRWRVGMTCVLLAHVTHYLRTDSYWDKTQLIWNGSLKKVGEARKVISCI